jgi:hypothetical protein
MCQDGRVHQTVWPTNYLSYTMYRIREGILFLVHIIINTLIHIK